MSASSSPRAAAAEKVLLQGQQEQDSSEIEDNQDEIDDFLLDQMLRKAERLASEVKLLAAAGGSLQRDICYEESGSPVKPCYSSVPNSIELNQPQWDAGTECSSVGCWLPSQDFRSYVTTMAEGEETRGNEIDSSTERSQNAVTPEDLRKEINSQPDRDQEAVPASEHAADNGSCDNRSKQNEYACATQAEAEILAALKAAREMKMQLEAVLIDSSQSGGSEENMDCSTSEEDHNSNDDDDILSFDDETHASTALEALTPDRKETKGHSAAKQLSVPKQLAEDDSVPVADYTRTSKAEPFFEKVKIATEGDQDYVPIRDYSTSPNQKGVPLREFTFSENHAVLIRIRRVRRRQRRLAVLALFFVTAAVLLLFRRSWSASPSTAPERMHDFHERFSHHQIPKPTVVESNRTAQKVDEASETTAPSKGIQDSSDALCLFSFVSFFSGACSSCMHLKSADKARVRAKRREIVENLVQIMMQ